MRKSPRVPNKKNWMIFRLRGAIALFEEVEKLGYIEATRCSLLCKSMVAQMGGK